MSESRETAKYSIGTVARVTGLSTHTLRVWERRYGAVEPARTQGGSRVYSDSDVDKLQLLKSLTTEGHSIGRIANLPTDELRSMVRRSPAVEEALQPSDVTETTKDRFLEALVELDLATAERLLLYAASSLEPRELVLRIVVPIITEIGMRWEHGHLRIAHEHAASALLRNLLGTLMRTKSPQPNAATAVVTTLSGELHEFGALMAALMAVVHGWKAVYLGPNLPADEILHVVEQADATALLLSFVGEYNRKVEAELGELVRRLPEDVDMIVGGRTASRYAAHLSRATITGKLTALEALLVNPRH